jgi:hypothetical protein
MVQEVHTETLSMKTESGPETTTKLYVQEFGYNTAENLCLATLNEFIFLKRLYPASD